MSEGQSGSSQLTLDRVFAPSHVIWSRDARRARALSFHHCGWEQPWYSSFAGLYT